MGTLIRHEQCPKCAEIGRDNSGDNLAVYDDGGKFCFSCSYYEGSGEKYLEKELRSIKRDYKLRTGIFSSISDRRISEKTCKFWGYKVDPSSGDQIATQYDDKKNPLGQKIRTTDKNFSINGTYDGLYGKWLWNNGRFLVITEGELDALSYSEVTNCSYPVVSLSKGASNASNDIKKDLKWIEDNFDTVILFFDNDEAGVTAMEKVAPLFSPGKCKIAKTSEKDANDLLVKGKVQELVNCVFRAKEYRPQEIISSDEDFLKEEVCRPLEVSDIDYPYTGLNNKTYGLRKGELVTICSGSGQGKSLFCKELGYHILSKGKRLAYIALEESYRDVCLSLMSIDCNTPLKLKPDAYSQADLREMYDKVIKNRPLYLYKDWGGEISKILSNIRYMIKGYDVEWVVLDHISILVSGLGSVNERVIIDELMTKLRSLVAETGVGMIIVSHLKRPSGEKGHEDGAKTSVAQLRGSAAIAQLSDMVIGLERNQQDEENSNEVTVRVLKNRYAGDTGIAGMLYYDKNTGRLLEDRRTLFSNEQDRKKKVSDAY